MSYYYTGNTSKKKKQYYDPQNGQHYYHGENLGAANWSAPESDKDETNRYANSYTPDSYELYQKYLRDIGAAPTENVATPQPTNTVTTHNLNELEKQYNENKIADLEDKLQKGILTPDEEAAYSRMMVNGLSENERKAMSKIAQGQSQEYKDTVGRTSWLNAGSPQLLYNANERILGNENAGKGYQSIEQGQQELKDLGWDNDKIKRFTQYQQAVTNKDETERNNDRFNINPDDSKLTKLAKSAYNSAYDLAYAPTRGVLGIMSNLEDRPEGFGRDIYSAFNARNNSTEEAQRQVVDNAITDKHKIGQKAYQIGMSTAEAIEAATIGGVVGEAVGGAAIANGATKEAAARSAKIAANLMTLPTFGMSAYDSTYKDAKQRGITEQQAQTLGVIGGAAEMATEVFSLDSLWDLARGTKAGRSMLVNWLAQSGIEGSEEFANDIINRAADYFVLGKDKKNQMSINIDNYMADGMTEKEAKKNAELDFWKGAFESFFMGAASGALMGAGGVVVGNQNAKRMGALNNAISDRYNSIDVVGNGNVAQNNQADKARYTNNPTQKVVDNFQVENEEDKEVLKVLEELSAKEREGKKLSKSDLAYIAENGKINNEFFESVFGKEHYNAVPDEFRTVSTNVSADDVANRMIDAASKGNIDEVMAAYRDGINSRNANARQMAEETLNSPVVSGQIQSKGVSVEQIEAGKQTQEEAYLMGLRGEEAVNLTENNQIAYNKGTEARIEQEKKTVIKSADEVKNAYYQTKDGKEVHLIGQFVNGGIRTAENEVVSIDDLDLSNESALSKAIKYADDYETTITKNTFMRGITDNTNIDQYARAFETAYNAGAEGFSWEATQKTGNVASFDNSTLKHAWKAGLTDVDTKRKENYRNDLASALNANTERKTGEIVNNSKLDNSSDEVQTLDRFASAFGINFVISDSMDSQGNFDNDNTIAIRSDRLRQVYHELGEFTKKYNNAELAELKKSVAAISADVMGVDKFNEFMNPYKRAYQEAGQDTSVHEMSDEMLFDAIAVIMGSENGQKAMAERLSKDYEQSKAKSLGQTIKDYFNAIINGLKKLVSTNKGSGYQQEVEKNIAKYEKIADEFIKVLDNASKVRDYVKCQDMSKEIDALMDSIKEYDESEGNKKFSLEVREDGLKYIEVNTDQNRFKGLDITGMVRESRKVIKELLNNSDRLLGEVDGTQIYGNHDTISHYAGAARRQYVKDNRYEAKLRTSAELNNIFDAAVFDSHKTYKQIQAETPGKHIDALQGITQYKIPFHVLDNWYIGYANVINKKDERQFYDITKIRRVDNGDIAAIISDSAVSDSSYKEMLSNYKNKSNKKFSLEVDSEGNKLTEDQQKFYEGVDTVDDEGRIKVLYHGTSRADRVGNMFDPDRATSGPMAFFTDDPQIAENYSKQKSDTSISRDSRYDSYYTQFRMNIDGKDMSIGEAWNNLPARARTEIRQKASHITFDDEYENIIYDENTDNGLGNFDKYLLNEHKNNYLEALVDAWIESGELFGDEARFKEVLSLVGLDNVEYLDPDFKDEKVYQVYLNIKKSFKTDSMYTNDWVDSLEKWWNNQDGSKYFAENFAADMWDKSSISVEHWIEKAREDIKENTTHAWTTIPDAVTDYLKSLGYDGVQDKGGKYHENDHTVYIPFYSEQVKNTDNLHPTTSKDIRYSLELPEEDFFMPMDFDDDNELSFLEGEDSVAGILEEGMKALKNKNVDSKKIRDIANKLKKEFKSSYNTDTLASNLEKAFAYMQTEDHVDYKTMMSIVEEIAKPVIDQATQKTGEAEYKKFLSDMKGYKIKLTENQKKEVSKRFGKYGNYTRMMMPITISEKGSTTLDQLWEELNGKYPSLFPMGTNEGDQAFVLSDALMTMRPKPQNSYGGDESDVAKNFAMRVVEEYVGGEASKKMEKKLDDYKKKLKSDYEKRVKEAAGKKDKEQIVNNKQKAQKLKDRQIAAEYRKKIATNANKLVKWIDSPTTEKHVPKDMVAPIVSFIHALNFVEPNVMQDQQGKFYLKVYTGNISIDENQNRHYESIMLEGDTKREVLDQFYGALDKGYGSKITQNWKQRMSLIADLYSKVSDDLVDDNRSVVEFVHKLSPALSQELKFLLANGNNNIRQLDASDLKVIHDVLSNIITAVNQGNKAYTMNSEIPKDGQSLIDQGLNTNNKDHTKAMQAVLDFVKISNVSPRTFFKVVGDDIFKYYEKIREGLSVEISDTKKASEFITKTMEELGIDQKTANIWTGKTGAYKEFRLDDGTTIRMTDNQIMSLYESAKRSGFADRIDRGGIKVSDIERSGKPTLKQNKAYKLTLNDIKNIIGSLTDQQKKFADALQKYMAVECAKDGNDTTMKMYGYEMFTEENYFPWKADPNTIAVTDSNIAQAGLHMIKNSSFTKARKEKASNPLIMSDIMDVYTIHVAGMAKYHGYTPALTDMLRLLNYKADNNASVQSALNEITNSDNGSKYVSQLLLDLNGASKNINKQNPLSDMVISNTKAASVMANLSVVVQQPTAYFRASNTVDLKYLLSVSPSKALKRAKTLGDENMLAWLKSQGYYETNIGKSLKGIITGQESIKDKINDKAGYLAGKADDITWAFLYEAVEKEQRDKLKGKNISKEDFRRKVNERFDDVVDQTQVIDVPLFKTQYMRSNDGLAKLQTAFMAEPSKSQNMLQEALLLDAKDSKAGGKFVPKRFSRAVAAWATSGVAAALAKSLITAARHKKDDDEYWDVYISDFLGEVIGNLNPFNLYPWVKEISGAIEKKLMGESASNLSRYDLDSILSLIDSVEKIGKMLTTNEYTPYGMIMTVMQPLSQISGIPAYALVRDLNATNNILPTPNLTMKYATETDKKKGVVIATDDRRSADKIKAEVTEAVESGVSIKDQRSYLESQYKQKYYELVKEGNIEEAERLAEMISPVFAMTGMSDESIDDMFDAWLGESVTYTELDKAIESGENIAEALERVQTAKDSDKIVEHIIKNYGSSVEYERENGTNSNWEYNVNRALAMIDGTYDYDTVKEDLDRKEAEKAQKKEESEQVKATKMTLYDAINKKDGSASRKAIQNLVNMGKDGGDIKSMVSTQHHQEWKDAQGDSVKQKAIVSKDIDAKMLIDNIVPGKKKKTRSEYEKEWQLWIEKNK